MSFIPRDVGVPSHNIMSNANLNSKILMGIFQLFQSGIRGEERSKHDIITLPKTKLKLDMLSNYHKLVVQLP